MLLTIACLHGIATNPAEQKSFAGRWWRYIDEALTTTRMERLNQALRGENVVDLQKINVKTLPLTWDSSGNGAKDIARVVANKSFRAAQINTIAKQLAEVLPQVDLIVTHSLGCALIQPVLNHLIASDDKPMLVGIGGPHSHPIWGQALSWAGLRADPTSPYWQARRPVHFWNQDDMVPSLGTRYSEPLGWESVRVAVPGDALLAKEHMDHHYLSHPLFIRQIEALCG